MNYTVESIKLSVSLEEGEPHNPDWSFRIVISPGAREDFARALL